MSFQNPQLLAGIPSGFYNTDDIRRVEAILRSHGTLTFSRLATGLFSASPAGGGLPASGYANVWVRDNVYVAYAHYRSGHTSVAAGVARALLHFFETHRYRFENIITGVMNPNDVSNRPYVRFDGLTLTEIAGQRWPHAQNDALGYFVWLYVMLARAGVLELTPQAVSTLALFPRYFHAIRFWEDEDNGHWEETRKISASSIGTVVAGLDALLLLAREQADVFQNTLFGEQLIATTVDLLKQGRTALSHILPHECAQLEPDKNRRYDAALLFLLFPLNVLNGPIVELLLHDVERFLRGEYGIRRYLGDSYWAPDYEDKLTVEERTRDFSEDLATRDALLGRIGDEAQWCLFDPILSAYYGGRFLATHDPADHHRQTVHFNRALGQITPAWNCPELYYVRQGQYVPNPHIPLQWTQANLAVALETMRTTAAICGH